MPELKAEHGLTDHIFFLTEHINKLRRIERNRLRRGPLA